MKQMYCKEHRLAVTSSLTGAILSAQINLLCKVSNCFLDTLVNFLKRHNLYVMRLPFLARHSGSVGGCLLDLLKLLSIIIVY